MDAEKELNEKKKSKAGRIVLMIALILLALVCVGASAAYIYACSKYNKLNSDIETFNEDDIYVNPELASTAAEQTTAPTSESEPVTQEAEPADKSYTTIMLYGVDTFSNSELERYGNADSEIICVIDNETYEVKLVSVLRDTFVETTTGKYKKLTDIYSAYGVKESLGTINKNFDLQIRKFATVNWRSIAKTINKLGGIYLHLSSAEVEYINNNYSRFSNGSGIATSELVNTGSDTYYLDGIQALAHASNRSVGHHDISRAERQRDILAAMLKAAKHCSFSELEDVIDTMLPGIATNLELSELLGMAMHISDYKIADNTVFPFKYSDQSDLRTAYVYCKTLTKNVTQLHEYLYGVTGYEPSRTVRNISDYILKYAKEHP